MVYPLFPLLGFTLSFVSYITVKQRKYFTQYISVLYSCLQPIHKNAQPISISVCFLSARVGTVTFAPNWNNIFVRVCYVNLFQDVLTQVRCRMYTLKLRTCEPNGGVIDWCNRLHLLIWEIWRQNVEDSYVPLPLPIDMLFSSYSKTFTRQSLLCFTSRQLSPVEIKLDKDRMSVI